MERPRPTIGLKRTLLLFGAAVALAATAAWASETVTYSYDARGRLVKVEHNSTATNNFATDYTYDRADNRTKRETK
jgi:YD repeat-containing protein